MEPRRANFGLLPVGIVLLTVATAVIHMARNFPDIMFLLNGLGYLALLAALYLPLPWVRNHRRLVHYVMIGYTALTILLWVVMGERSLVGYVDKAIELALIGLLVVQLRQIASPQAVTGGKGVVAS